MLDCVKLMSPVDAARFDDSYRVPLLHRVLATAATAPMFIKTYMPWYTPHKYDVPDSIDEISRELSAAAKSVT